MNPHYHYTPHHEPSPPSSSGPTTHYLAVSSSSSSSTNAVIVRHRRHHRVGCCLVPPAATVILTIVVHRRCNPTNDGVPATLPRPPPPLRPPPPVAIAPSPPSRSPMALSWTCMRHQCPPSRSDSASAAPARTPLVGIRAHCASAAVTTAAMPRFPLWRPAVDPPLLLGPPSPVGRRRRQHGNVDACPWQPGATTTTP
jgi:hypothetical protein